MPKTRSGLDTTDDSISTAPASNVKRPIRKRKLPHVNIEKKKASKLTTLKNANYYLDQLSTSLPKLEYYHNKSSKPTRFYEVSIQLDLTPENVNIETNEGTETVFGTGGVVDS